jgi:hypothetical protein
MDVNDWMKMKGTKGRCWMDELMDFRRLCLRRLRAITAQLEMPPAYAANDANTGGLPH